LFEYHNNKIRERQYFTWRAARDIGAAFMGNLKDFEEEYPEEPKPTEPDHTKSCEDLSRKKDLPKTL
jgi:hypothetical protein